MAQQVTTGKAAAELGVSAIRVRQLIADGRLPATKAGRDWLIKAKDLDRVRERQRTGRPKKIQESA